MSTREATHAKSWYSGNANQLKTELKEQLTVSNPPKYRKVKGVISPHAGYKFSGPCAAWAQKNLDPTNVNNIFILGPSHFKQLNSIELTSFDCWETPLGKSKINTEIQNDLKKSKLYKTIETKIDNKEHSLEMQLPQIHQMMGEKEHTIVPLTVGDIQQGEKKDLEEYAKKIASYLDMDDSFISVSSDFAHWGGNFDYQQLDKSDTDLNKQIENNDRRGMDLIEKQDAKGFLRQLEETKNTICGRNPISLLLESFKYSGRKQNIKFVNYDQSSLIDSKNDSRVSYAAAIIQEE